MTRSRRPRIAFVLFAVLALFVSACGSDVALPDAVTRQLDIPNNSIATVSDSISEDVPRIDLLQATSRARALGTELRFVIAGDTDELVDAQAVADRYGGTVLSYKSGDARFTASGDMDNDQLDRAIAAASGEPDMGSSALAFVRQLEDEGGIKERSSGVPWWIWLLLAVAILFVLWQLRSYLEARKRATRRRDNFAHRREILRDWAQRLGPEVDMVQPHYARLDPDGRRMLDESRSLIESVVPAVADASSLGELDASEIRIARTAIKLRTLRQQLGV